jgi:hypothetical protein
MKNTNVPQSKTLEIPDWINPCAEIHLGDDGRPLRPKRTRRAEPNPRIKGWLKEQPLKFRRWFWNYDKEIARQEAKTVRAAEIGRIKPRRDPDICDLPEPKETHIDPKWL